MKRFLLLTLLFTGLSASIFGAKLYGSFFPPAQGKSLCGQLGPGTDTSLVFVDQKTKLMWMKHDFSFLKNRFLEDWAEIFSFQKEMDSARYAGFSDWRVPTIQEYRTLNRNAADRKAYHQNFIEIDSISVWGPGPYSFWSRTTPNKYTASYISFIDGFATSGSRSKKFSSIYSDWKGVELGMSVRLVRNVNGNNKK